MGVGVFRRVLMLGAVVTVGGCESSSQNTTTISGTAVTEVGRLAGGVVVGILSSNTLQTVVTDADGGFTLKGVTVPYDGMVADSAAQNLTIYQGLTTSHPTLTAFVAASSLTSRSATLEGSVSAAATAVGDIEEFNLDLVTPLGFAVEFGNFIPPTGTFEMRVGWSGPATVSSDLYILSRHQVFSGTPTAIDVTTVWDGFAKVAGITLDDGRTVTGLDAGLEAIDSGSISGTVTLPAGFNPASPPLVVLYAHPVVGPSFYVNPNKLSLESADFAFDAPDLPGIPLQVEAVGESDGGAGYIVLQTVPVGASGANVTFPAPASPVSPAHSAGLQGSSASFSWTAVGDAGVYLFQIVGNGTVSVFTTQLSATLPDVSRFHLTFLGSSTWVVASFATPSNVDQLVGDGGVGVLLQGDLVETISVLRGVTLE